MRHIFTLLIILISLFTFGCGSRGTGSANTNGQPTNTEAATPKDGYYWGKGVVTKINNDLGSVEIDHEDIVDLMPAMKMEFNVKDKAMLKNVATGDRVIFVIEYRQGTEIVASIEKAK